MGYNGTGEVLLDGEVVHGFSNPSLGKVVEVSEPGPRLLSNMLNLSVSKLCVCACVLCPARLAAYVTTLSSETTPSWDAPPREPSSLSP